MLITYTGCQILRSFCTVVNYSAGHGFACHVSNGHGENSGQDERELITRDEFTGVSKQGDSSRIANAIVVILVTRLLAVVQGCRTYRATVATLTRIMTAG